MFFNPVTLRSEVVTPERALAGLWAFADQGEAHRQKWEKILRTLHLNVKTFRVSMNMFAGVDFYSDFSTYDPALGHIVLNGVYSAMGWTSGVHSFRDSVDVTVDYAIPNGSVDEKEAYAFYSHHDCCGFNGFTDRLANGAAFRRVVHFTQPVTSPTPTGMKDGKFILDGGFVVEWGFTLAPPAPAERQYNVVIGASQPGVGEPHLFESFEEFTTAKLKIFGDTLEFLVVIPNPRPGHNPDLVIEAVEYRDRCGLWSPTTGFKV